MSAPSFAYSEFSQASKTQPRFESIMVIGSNEADLFITSILLKESRIAAKTLTTADTANALTYLESAAFTVTPDLIFIDQTMLQTQQSDFLQQFNQLPEIVKQRSRIIITTWNYDKKVRLMGLSNPHVVGYLPKPFDSLQLREYSI